MKEKVLYRKSVNKTQGGGTFYVNEPHPGGGAAVLSSKDGVMFNDILGTTLGVNGESGYTSTPLTAFGDTLPSSGGPQSLAADALFTGKPLVDGLGHAFLFRNYRAGLGKWLTADPLGYPDGWNQLAYVEDMPISHVDVFGACKTCGSHCQCYNLYYPEWFHDNDVNNLYCLGRNGFPVFNPEHPIAKAIEDYFPNAHYFAVVHDSWVDQMNFTGVLEWVTNISSMPFAYLFGFGTNMYDSFLDFLDYMQDTFGLDIVSIDDWRPEPIKLKQCQCIDEWPSGLSRTVRRGHPRPTARITLFDCLINKGRLYDGA